MEDIQVGQHIQDAVNIVAVAWRPDSDTVIGQFQDMGERAAAD